MTFLSIDQKDVETWFDEDKDVHTYKDKASRKGGCGGVRIMQIVFERNINTLVAKSFSSLLTSWSSLFSLLLEIEIAKKICLCFSFLTLYLFNFPIT